MAFEHPEARKRREAKETASEANSGVVPGYADFISLVPASVMESCLACGEKLLTVDMEHRQCKACRQYWHIGFMHSEA